VELESLIEGRQATEAWRSIRSIKKEQKGNLSCMITMGEALFRTINGESAGV
jgi:hypothetical protein